MNRLAWVLVCCLVLAGCASAGPETTATRTTTVDSVETTARLTPTPVDTPVRTPSGGKRVTVTRVVDGDTLEIRYGNGTTDTVRLLGVDTPEVHVPNTPEEYEGVPDTERGAACLRAEGHDASAFIHRVLADERVRLVIGDDQRGRYDRLLAFVFLDGRNVNYRLVAEGYARVYDSRFRGRERFYRAEARAQRKHIGLWRCASTQQETPRRDGHVLAVVEIDANAPGNDDTNLDAESVVFENTGQSTLDLSGWTVADTASHRYTFPTGFVLDSGERVRLHSGRGQNSRTDLYWGTTSAVWNNDGDTIVVRTAEGEIVVRRSYT